MYKKGKTGIKTFDGLGASQMKEVAYLEKHFYPNKDYIEVDATEFEAQNTMNRAQIYKSAVEGLLQLRSKRPGSAELECHPSLVLPFMQALADAL